MKFLNSASIKNKTVLVRIDVNEPLDAHQHLIDDFRIQAILPTVKFLHKNGCKVILCSHLGRPDGSWDKTLSLKPIAERLATLLELKFTQSAKSVTSFPADHLVFFTGNIEDGQTKLALDKVSCKNVVVLENLRFYKGEDENSPFFAKRLAELADVYVNDAFAVSHRASASVSAITKYLPSYAGPLLEKEIRNLDRVLKNPAHPFVVMMGGIKMADKAKTLQNLGKQADIVLLGGGLANLILKSTGVNIGKSLVDLNEEALAKQLLQNYKDKIILPKDAVVANKKMTPASIRATPIYDVKDHEVILDIGPQTILEYARILKTAKTIVWNGPMGHFEVKPFHTGTMALARIIGAVSSGRAFGVVGGGETATAIRQAHQASYIDHLSTGGGAMLEYLAGNKLPGLVALG